VAALTVLLPVGPPPRPHLEATLGSLAEELPSPDARLLAVFDGTEPTATERRLLDALQARVAVLPKRDNLGQVLDAGLRLVDTPLTSRIDADDLWPRSRLSGQLRFMDAHPDCAVAGSDATTVDVDGRPLGTLRAGRGRDLRRGLLLRNQLIHPSTVFRTELARRAGGYPDVERVEDYGLWLRLAQLGDVLNAPERWLTYRVHPRQLSRRRVARPGRSLIGARRAELARHLGVAAVYPSFAQLAWSGAQVCGRLGLNRLWTRFEGQPAA
jgi:hypothetical protein